MLEHVAVLSDIHGVLPALEAVLAEPDVTGADAIVLTGDLAAGPLPGPTLDALVALGERAVWVRGNADRELLAPSAAAPPESRWAATQLTEDHRARLATLPHPVTLPLKGFGPVLFCHGTPRDDEEVILVDSPLDRYAEVLSTVDDDVRTVVCGHTHMPFARLADGRLVVNPGSVGMPYGRAGAHWALLSDGAVQLRRTDFDLDVACARIARESAYPGAAAWAEEYLRARNTDRDALVAFSPRTR
ncbi:putative phosphoesterase [Crossiella equi]|uniref:Phosphoesterase n=1 Tax=Crossiella equi TaxID=130796 RepID=A0ABS5A8L8_9PSEU|nr:metallophosphoesterase family protein [Crossiella equi]MBP2472943.1 putative phosphoesterase [Crossiella equi]